MLLERSPFAILFATSAATSGSPPKDLSKLRVINQPNNAVTKITKVAMTIDIWFAFSLVTTASSDALLANAML